MTVEPAAPRAKLILASASPRRLALLQQAGLEVDHLLHQDGGDHAGDDDDERDEHLREGADDRGLAGRGDRVRGHRALDLDEVRGPVPEGQHEAEPEDQADHREHRVVDRGDVRAGGRRRLPVAPEPTELTPTELTLQTRWKS